LIPKSSQLAGYSEYRPIRPNDTAENRAMNRRVDIVILNIDLWDFEPN
jgi:chemotaxis protein MotB